MNIAYSENEIIEACRKIVSVNDLHSGAYIRPIAFRGYNDLGLHASMDDDIEVVVAAWEWGTYLGADALENGVDVCISSWNRECTQYNTSYGKGIWELLIRDIGCNRSKRKWIR